MKSLCSLAMLAAAATHLTGCTTHNHNRADHADHHADVTPDPANGVVLMTPASPLVAVFRDINGSGVAGAIFFTPETVEGKQAVRVRGTVTGLDPNGKHGFHVHAYGDATDLEKGSSASVHFNPFGTEHVLGAAAHGHDHDHGHSHDHDQHAAAHPGDFPNLEADAAGTATFDIVSKTLSLTTGPTAVVGRSLIIHEAEDVGTQPWGGAGGRIAVGIIGLADPNSIPADAQ
ncbi:MAG: superoxide dismutase family protein [Planctomycetota bacterium]